MRRILLDTNAYAAFKRGEAAALSVMQLADDIALSVVVLAELLAGFALGSRADRNRAELSDFLDSPRVRVVPVTAETAERYAAVFLALRRKGKPIPTNDLWIAAQALEGGYALFSYDERFQAIDGLLAGSRVEDFLP